MSFVDDLLVTSEKLTQTSSSLHMNLDNSKPGPSAIPSWSTSGIEMGMCVIIFNPNEL